MKLNFKDIFIPTISLFLICLVVTAALSLTNSMTAQKIADNEQASKEESMKTVCPQAQAFEEIIPEVLYEGKDSAGNSVGYAVSTSAAGYGGQVKVMTGISEGVIIGVDVFYNDDETPGLGKNTSNESFTAQYKGLLTERTIAVSKDGGEGQTVDAVTSATISSRAVTAAVNEARDIYNEQIGATLRSDNDTDTVDEEYDLLEKEGE